MFMMAIMTGIFSFFLIILFHYFYIKIGILISRDFLKTKSGKYFFWTVYIIFGFFLVYTDYFWARNGGYLWKEPYYDINIYEDTNNSFKKLNIHGISNPKLNLAFSVSYVNNEKKCEVRKGYPVYKHFRLPISSVNYNVDIFLNYEDKRKKCIYKIEKIALASMGKRDFYNVYDIYRYNIVDKSVISSNNIELICRPYPFDHIGLECSSKTKFYNYDLYNNTSWEFNITLDESDEKLQSYLKYSSLRHYTVDRLLNFEDISYKFYSPPSISYK